MGREGGLEEPLGEWFWKGVEAWAVESLVLKFCDAPSTSKFAW